MESLKLVSWNIEQSDQLLGPDHSPLATEPYSARLAAIREEIAELDADVLAVTEGPKGEQRALSFFRSVAPNYDLVVRGTDDPHAYGISGTQWIWLLLRKGRGLSGSLQHLDRWRELTEPGWGEQWRAPGWEVSYPIFDVEAKSLHFKITDKHRHYRHPQVLGLQVTLPDGSHWHCEIIACHLKSKINKVHPKGDPYAADFFDAQPALVADVMTSRIKLTTEATDIRHYIEARFAAEPDAPIIVVGDLNDGPGKERIEQRFMYHDLLSNLQGDVFLARQFLNHALFDFDDGARWSYDLGRDKLDPGRSPRILLDHILFTQSLSGRNRAGAAAFRARPSGGLVEHDVHHRVAARRARSAQTSDHRPVSMVFDLRTS